MEINISSLDGITLATEGKYCKENIHINLSNNFIDKTGKIILTPTDDLKYTGIDTDGTLFNGTGYIEGYRLNSSNALVTSAGAVTSGFIAVNGDENIQIFGDTTAHYIWMYDSSFTQITFVSNINISKNYTIALNANTSYIRITLNNNTYHNSDVQIRKINNVDTYL